MKKTTICALLLLGLMARPAPAGDAENAAALVRGAVDAVLECLRDKALTVEDKRARIVGIIEPLFDFALMGKLTLGPRHWAAMSPAEQDEFIALFTQRLKDSYLGKIELFTDGQVTYDPPEAAGNKIHVATHILSKGDEVKVVYKLYRQDDGKWRGYDFEVKDVSMVASYRSQYDQALRAGTARELLDRMKEQSAAAAP